MTRTRPQRRRRASHAKVGESITALFALSSLANGANTPTATPRARNGKHLANRGQIRPTITCPISCESPREIVPHLRMPATAKGEQLHAK
jgi:hypothetical protein